MHVELLNYTPRPEVQVARAARLCYYGSDIDQLKETMTSVKSAELVRKLVKMGHLSTVEHVTFTFGIEGVSRALSHQLVRHRIASYSQQSQRYVDGDKSNLNLDNLALISRAANARRNLLHLHGDTTELGKIAAVTAELLTMVGKRRKKK